MKAITLIVMILSSNVVQAQDIDDAMPADILATLQNDKVSYFDLALLRAEWWTRDITDEYAGKHVGSASPTFEFATVLPTDNNDGIVFVGYFVDPESRLNATRGNCADALEGFRHIVFLSAQVELDETDEFVSRLLRHPGIDNAHAAEGIGTFISIGYPAVRDMAIACGSKIDGRDVRFEAFPAV